MNTEHWFNERGVIYDENRLTVAFVYGQEEDDSDARRMAASNQMLDALKQVADRLNSVTLDLDTTRQLVREAIRAAEDPPEITTLRGEEALWHELGERYADPARSERWIVLDGQGRAGDAGWEWSRRPSVQQIERTLDTRELADRLKQQRESDFGQSQPYIVRDVHDYAHERASEAREHIERLLPELRRPLTTPDTPSNRPELVWSHATGPLASTLPDETTDQFSSPPSATARQLRLPLSLSAHSDLLVALQDFAQAVWSDVRLPGNMRQELQAQYRNVVRPAISSAQEELDRRIARLVARDPSSEPGDRSVAYSEGPWVVKRDPLGELQPFNTDGSHLLSSEGNSPLPLEEREANGRLIGAAPQHDARLRATTAFLRRLVSAHPDEIADYMIIAAEHCEKNIGALTAIEPDAGMIPPASEPYLQILEDYWTAIEAVPADAIDPVLIGLAQNLGIEAEPLRNAYNHRKRTDEVRAVRSELSHRAEEYPALSRSHTDEDPRPPQPAESLVAGIEASASPSDHAPITAADVIVTRIQAVRNILREHGWDGALAGELRKQVGAMTLVFDHKVETVSSGRNLDVSVAYIAWDTSEGEHNDGDPLVVQLTDPMTSQATELVSRFEAELEAALRARGRYIDLQQGTTPDELAPR